MTQTLITAGDSSAPLAVQGGDDGTLVIKTGAAGSKVNAVVYAADGTPTFLKSGMVLGTAQATTSGTSVDFTGIPSWVKRITINLKGSGTSGTSVKQLQVGNGSPVTSGYVTSMTQFGASSIATSGNAAGIGIYSNTAADRLHGQIVLALENAATNSWTWHGGVSASPSGVGFWTIGGISLSSALDRIRLTTVGGTDTFVAGEVNILYEG